ncbi:hypothetical protein K440DRAFT_212107 [Wilcoxina mikolae CBS 423.85]|nr:hypothetical protein K440DRAFT_212107 [Wilcoxina mikolae CBS 423.85]
MTNQRDLLRTSLESERAAYDATKRLHDEARSLWEQECFSHDITKTKRETAASQKAEQTIEMLTNKLTQAEEHNNYLASTLSRMLSGAETF